MLSITESICLQCGEVFTPHWNSIQALCKDCLYANNPLLLKDYSKGKITYELTEHLKSDWASGSKKSADIGVADVLPKSKPKKTEPIKVETPKPVKPSICDGTSRFCSLESFLAWSERMALKAPFGYFGNKDIIAPEIWRLAGDVQTYIEPFGGTMSVLRNRPVVKGQEIINDGDCLLINAWRAVKHDPEKLAVMVDDILFAELELNARRNFLKQNRDDLYEKVAADPNYYDADLAADFLWCASASIDGAATIYNPARQSGGMQSKPSKGVLGKTKDSNYLKEWFRELSIRLRYTTIMCRDAKQILGAEGERSAFVGKEYMEPFFIFIDPPYATGKKWSYYTNELCDWLQDWCISNGNQYKIILAGYSDDYHKPFPQEWQIQTWKQGIGFAAGAKDLDAAKDKQGVETLWISPACIAGQKQQASFAL